MQNSDDKKMLFYVKLATIFAITIVMGLVFNLYTDRLYDERHFGAEFDKLSALKEMQGEKTVFVGGSSLLTGFNAEHYTEISGEPTINMGLHALDIYDVYLATIVPYIHRGDKVILAFEYMPYKSNWDEYNDVGLIVAHESKEYFRRARIKYLPQYAYQQTLRSYPKLYEVVYHYTVETRLKGEEKAYLRKNINGYGDLKAEINANTESPIALGVSTEITDAAKREIKYYIDKIEKVGAKVYIVFPPLYTKTDPELSRKQLDEFLQQMKESFGSERVLGHPLDWMFNTDEKFWDTGYHLNAEASLEHTEYYYELIKRAEQ